eukprot:TRINITY_DN3132_c0_g6_i1.p1 TRINITY_DN3132_c0_g6~~TRINITY_DN3132_c0_g6_i1.p1  ORF type:complete len:423 (+),score=121.36 TRINITY_DN3132_c0_g6_i1:33-1271(+)
MDNLSKELLDPESVPQELLTKSLNVLRNAKNHSLNGGLDMLKILSKKRGQTANNVMKLLDEAFIWVDECRENDDDDSFLLVIDKIREISAGKLFLELQWIKATRILGQYYFNKEEVDKALELYLEIRVEAVGSLSKLERFEVVLEQVKLMLLKDKFILASMSMRNVSDIMLKTDEMQHLVFEYYEYKTKILFHEGKYFDLAMCRVAQFEVPKPEEFSSITTEELVAEAIVFACISEYSPERNNLLQALIDHKNLVEFPKARYICECLLGNDLLVTYLQNDESVLDNLSNFIAIVQEKYEFKELSLDDIMVDTILEHNLRVVSKVFSNGNLESLADLLQTNAETIEEKICELIERDEIACLIDRPARIVNFVDRKAPSEILNNWGDQIEVTVDLLGKACHFINVEKARTKNNQ